jgi:hypothetical protein
LARLWWSAAGLNSTALAGPSLKERSVASKPSVTCCKPKREFVSFVLPILFYPHTGEAERRSQFPKRVSCSRAIAIAPKKQPSAANIGSVAACRSTTSPLMRRSSGAKEFGNRVTLATMFGGRQGFLDGDERRIESSKPH